ncbi:MAG TPA: diguanylate cyclase, partial [Sporolactobacillaceae bacterium]|nr:diguanylate cyclase [Sporolactobacillaceae bacterium]
MKVNGMDGSIPLEPHETGAEAGLLKELKTIFRRLDIAVWSANLDDQQLLCVSSTIQDIFDLPLKDVTLDTWRSMVHPDDLELVTKANNTLFKEGKVAHTYRIVTPKNQTKWIYEHIIMIKDPNSKGTHVLGSLEDITALRELQQQVHELSFIDSLTQLPNRYSGRVIIKNLIAQSEKSKTRFAIFYLNLKGLNQINDTFGHDVGDDVMKQTAHRIHLFAKECGTACRVSGNQFIATIERFKDTETLYKMAQSLINAIEAPLTISGYTLYVSAMIGISLFPDDGRDLKDLIKTSRAALARAKQMGDGQIQVYSSSMNIASFKALQLDSDLRRAIENGEFYLEYQPKICFHTQKAVGAEALIRWKHPVWGVVSPTEFMAVAEASSFIQQIGDF